MSYLGRAHIWGISHIQEKSPKMLGILKKDLDSLWSRVRLPGIGGTAHVFSLMVSLNLKPTVGYKCLSNMLNMSEVGSPWLSFPSFMQKYPQRL